jgi:N-hydroxyarylamine O-acetyltransferase
MRFPTLGDEQFSSYLRRIEFEGDLRADLATLDALHLAHATHIPFENLDVLLRRPIRLDLDSLHAKLVGGRRGGYCFEHNLLFAAALEKIGFAVTRLAGRVRYGSTVPRPRTHTLLSVEVDGTRWLADVGFGAEGLLLPVPMADASTRQFAWTYRIVGQPGRSLCNRCARQAGWICTASRWSRSSCPTTRWPTTSCRPIRARRSCAR